MATFVGVATSLATLSKVATFVGTTGVFPPHHLCPLVVRGMVHLEDITGPGTVALVSLGQVRGLVVIDRISADPGETTWAVHLHHVLLHMCLHSLLSGRPLAYQTLPFVRVGAGTYLLSQPLLGPVRYMYQLFSPSPGSWYFPLPSDIHVL